MGAWTATELTARHKEILRLKFLGRSNIDIAVQMGIDPQTVGLVVRSPLAQAELARLSGRAEDSLTDVPRRARLLLQLEEAGEEAIELNRRLMKEESTNFKGEPLVPARVKAGIAKHFIDRGVVGLTGQEQEGSIREILRSLDRIEQTMHAKDITPVYQVNGDDLQPIEVENAGRVSTGDSRPTSGEAPTLPG